MSTTAGRLSTAHGGGGLAKLTVPQLKALCKERRIVGYSKLGKAALIQKLTLTLGVTTIQNNDTSTHNLQHVLPIQVISGIKAPDVPESTSCHTAGLVCQTPSSPRFSGAISLNHQHTLRPPVSASGSANLVTQSSAIGDRSPVSHVDERSQAPNGDHGKKRPCISAMFQSAKKQKSSATNAVSTIYQVDSSSSMKVPSARTSMVHASVTEPPSLAVSRPPHWSSISNPVPSAPRHAHPVQAEKEYSSKRRGRFKPLVLAKPLVAAGTAVNHHRTAFNGHTDDEIACVFPGIFSIDAAPLSTPLFVNITLPPKLCDRKRVQIWAIILCALSVEDRRTCVLVSRAFRYAVYLSAAHILAQKFHGRRLDRITKRYSQNMTNMWPYLRQRQNEVAFRRQAFQNSFVGRYLSAFGIEPIVARLWASPDDEKQAVIALRFVLTGLWFTLSVGTNGQDPSIWLKHAVVDAQEVVKSEIWAITIQDGNSLSVFHVLESTCEVIGRAHNAPQPPFGLRSDWSEYISSHTGSSIGSCSLVLEHFRWANYEEYDRGISRHWLRRISREGDVGLWKKVVAERYVMACVVANSISGQRMSSHQMAQEFAGLPSKTTVDTARGKIPKVNLYLPAHHHVESVHFTTPKNVPLHPAVAVVQTPAREYIVLRDNGMQVGCEEDGVANVWMHVLGCDANGVAVVCTK